jgi:hypothetical protein
VKGLAFVRFVRAFSALVLLSACTTGEGQGEVTSDRLFVRDCWDGPFRLQPTFFGANPNRGTTLIIQVQRGDNSITVSDGLLVSITDLPAVRKQRGQPIPVGLPAGLETVGAATEPRGPSAPVSMALYVQGTCNPQNGTLYSLEGQITFDSLFSGDPNELEASERLTEATFDAEFADPRLVAATSDPAGAGADVVSRVEGWFRFFFQRGPPAQPFP